MRNSQSRAATGRVALAVACAAGLGVAVPTAARAAAAPVVVPTPLTGCYGKLAHDASGAASKEPNLLSYQFECDTPISSYTIVYNQTGAPNGTLDDFGASPTVLETDALTPSPSESLTCAATLPSDGINCNTPAMNATINADYVIGGTIDPVQAYCKHLPLTARGKLAAPGTPAIGKARVDLIVTDNTGAEDGPFYLGRAKPCTAKVPNRVPAAPTGTTGTTSTSQSVARPSARG